MPLVVLVTNSLAVSWNGAEGACDDIPHDGPHTLVLFLPCCLEPVQMSHVVSYLARVCQVKCVSFFRYHKRRCVTSDCWL